MTAGINRLGDAYGRLIDRETSLAFSFEEREYRAFSGDCIASALAAADQWVLSRSFKFRRPRGILTMAGNRIRTPWSRWAASPTCWHGPPSVVTAGARGQRPEGYDISLAVDAGSAIGLFARFLPVGFYYKAFYKYGSWKFWEPVIRNRAGLGRIDRHAPHGYFDKQYLFADVAIVGGGPAGLSAAIAAADSGAEVVLIEECPILGGSLTYSRFERDGGRSVMGEELASEVAQRLANIRVMTDATCRRPSSPTTGFPVIKGRRLYISFAPRPVVVASGSHEQPAVLRNNDLPRAS